MALRLSLIPPILNSLPGRAIAPVFQAQDTDTPTPTATDTPAQTPTDTPTPTATPASQSGSIAINYIYDPLYRLEEANYSTGDYYHYTYDAVGNRETQTTQLYLTR